MRSDPNIDPLRGADDDLSLQDFETFEALLLHKPFAELSAAERNLVLGFAENEADYTEQRQFALKMTGSFAAERRAGPDPAEPDEVLLRNLHEAVRQNAAATDSIGSGGGGVIRPNFWARVSTFKMPVYQAAAVVALLIAAWWAIPRWQQSAGLKSEIIVAGADAVGETAIDKPGKPEPAGKQSDAPKANSVPAEAKKWPVSASKNTPPTEVALSNEKKEVGSEEAKPRLEWPSGPKQQADFLADKASSEPPAVYYADEQADVEGEDDLAYNLSTTSKTDYDYASSYGEAENYYVPTKPSVTAPPAPKYDLKTAQQATTADVAVAEPTYMEKLSATSSAVAKPGQVQKPKSADKPQTPVATMQGGVNVGTLIQQQPVGQNASQTNAILGAFK